MERDTIVFTIANILYDIVTMSGSIIKQSDMYVAKSGFKYDFRTCPITSLTITTDEEDERQ